MILMIVVRICLPSKLNAGQEEKYNPKSLLSCKFCSCSILKLKGNVAFLVNHPKFWIYHITLKGKEMALSRQRLSLIGFRGEISSSSQILKRNSLHI